MQGSTALMAERAQRQPEPQAQREPSQAPAGVVQLEIGEDGQLAIQAAPDRQRGVSFLAAWCPGTLCWGAQWTSLHQRVTAVHAIVQPAPQSNQRGDGSQG